MSNLEFEKYCTGCSNLIKSTFNGVPFMACGGNVGCPSKCVLAKKQYSLKVNNSKYLIPKDSIKGFALMKAIDNGLTHGNIHDEETAVEYLTSIGYEISEAY